MVRSGIHAAVSTAVHDETISERLGAFGNTEPWGNLQNINLDFLGPRPLVCVDCALDDISVAREDVELLT